MTETPSPPAGPRPVSRRRRFDDRSIAGALALAVVAVGLICGSRAAGGADSSGYVSQSVLWRRGQLVTPQPLATEAPWPAAIWSFSPLGYVPSPDGTSLVPRYPAGLPLIMATAQLAAGPCAAFWVVPLSGGVLVLATWGLGRRLVAPGAGLVAAWLVATSPIVLAMLLSPMSDLPAAAAWAVMFWALTIGTPASATVAGMAAAIAILIRPNLAPLVLAPATWLAFDAWRGRSAGRLRQFVLFAVAAAPGVALTAWIHWWWYGSPLSSGYETFDELFVRQNVVLNAGRYLAWFADTQTPVALLGLAALFVPARRLWPNPPGRSMALTGAAFTVGLTAPYLAYAVFDTWRYLRFLLPAWPLVMIALAAVAWRIPGHRRLTLALAVVLVGLGGVGIRSALERGVFDTQRLEHVYIGVGRLVRDVTPPDGIVLSMQHSGSIRHYAGRQTLQFESLDPDWLDRAVEWLAGQGRPVYAVLEDWEVEVFRRRFESQRIGRLEMPPLVRYRSLATVYLYDLQRPAEPGPTERVMETFNDLRCEPPAPAPARVFR